MGSTGILGAVDQEARNSSVMGQLQNQVNLVSPRLGLHPRTLCLPRGDQHQKERSTRKDRQTQLSTTLGAKGQPLGAPQGPGHPLLPTQLSR